MYNSENERIMLEAAQSQVRLLLDDQMRFNKDRLGMKVGFESELALIPPASTAVEKIEILRNQIIRGNPWANYELGAAQIELRTPPIDVLEVNGWHKLNQIHTSLATAIVDQAHAEKAQILRCGANPFLPTHNPPRTSKPKYQQVPDFYNRYQRQGVNRLFGRGDHKVDLRDAAVVSLFQAFQINLEAQSLHDAIQKANYAMMIAPYLVALGANARFLELTDMTWVDHLPGWEANHNARIGDTTFADIRAIGWETSFDDRTAKYLTRGSMLRIGLPETYFRNIEHYLNRTLSFPFILFDPENALNIAIGMHWMDARIKFVGDSAVVELRPLATQPTPQEELTLALLYLGRLTYAQHTCQPLLPFDCLKKNRLKAMRTGSSGNFWFQDHSGNYVKLPYNQGINLELQRAYQGLNILGLGNAIEKQLVTQMLHRNCPSTWLSQLLDQKPSVTHTQMTEALQAAQMLL